MLKLIKMAVAGGLFLAPMSAEAAMQPLASQVAESCHVWANARQLTGVSGYVGAAATNHVTLVAQSTQAFDCTSSACTDPLSLINTGITTDATHTDATVCEDTTTHQFYFGLGTVGICLGTSSMRYKTKITPLAPESG